MGYLVVGYLVFVVVVAILQRGCFRRLATVTIDVATCW